MRKVLRITYSVVILSLAAFSLTATAQERDGFRAGIGAGYTPAEVVTPARADSGCMLLGGTWYCW